MGIFCPKVVTILTQRATSVKPVFKKSKFALIVFLFYLFINTSALTSCSKPGSAPQPPHLKAQLVSELFTALRQQNYEMALTRIYRLRELSPDDVALQTMQINVQNNLVMQRVQTELDKGNIDAGIKIIDDFSLKNGQTADLRDAVRELNVLKDIKVCFDNIASEYGSTSKFLTISQNSTDSLGAITQEKALGLEDLKADIDTSWVMENENLDTLLAILEVANPKDSLVLAYRKSMSKDWSNFNINANYLDINTEFLVFRILANTSFEDKNLLKKIASFAPNNYRDMLAKSIMLNFVGDLEKSNSMLSSMKNELDVQDNIYKSWFVLTPRTSSISDLNPLITKPFFIYCNKNALTKAQ